VIGSVHLLQSRTKEAILWLEKARSANSASPYPHAWLASGYALKEDLERARAELVEARRLLADILQIPVPTRAMVSLLGCRHNKYRPGRLPWRAKAEDCRARGAGTRAFVLIKAYLCRGSWCI
jgi:hypothetical protein